MKKNNKIRSASEAAKHHIQHGATHVSHTHVTDSTITANGIEDAKAQFSTMLDAVKLDYDVMSINLKIFGFIRTACHPIEPAID